MTNQIVAFRSFAYAPKIQPVNDVQGNNRCSFWNQYKTLCSQNVEFLGAFAKLRKTTMGLVMSVRPSFRMEQLCVH